MTDTNRSKPNPEQAADRGPPSPENKPPKSRPQPKPDGEAIAELGDQVGGPA